MTSNECCICWKRTSLNVTENTLKQKWLKSELHAAGLDISLLQWVCEPCQQLIEVIHSLKMSVQVKQEELRDRHLGKPEVKNEGCHLEGKIVDAPETLPTNEAGLDVLPVVPKASLSLPEPSVDLPAVVFADAVLSEQNNRERNFEIDVHGALKDNADRILPQTNVLSDSLKENCRSISHNITETRNEVVDGAGGVQVLSMLEDNHILTLHRDQTDDSVCEKSDSVSALKSITSLPVGEPQTPTIDLSSLEPVACERLLHPECLEPALVLTINERTVGETCLASAETNTEGFNQVRRSQPNLMKASSKSRKLDNSKRNLNKQARMSFISENQNALHYSSTLPLKKRVRKTLSVRLSQPSTDTRRGSSLSRKDMVQNETRRQNQRKEWKESYTSVADGWKCLHCPAEFKTANGASAHALVHSEPSEGMCGKCGRKYANVYTLRRHRTTCGDDSLNATCSVCAKVFTDSAYVKRHMLLHSEDGLGSFICEVCGVTFASSRRLRSHSANVHHEESCTCDICGAEFKLQQQLSRHKRNVHSSANAIKCDLCGRRFKRAEHLRAHMAVHSQNKPFQCSHCEKSFSRRDTLDDHVRLHTGERPYTCDLCGAAFREVRRRNQHVRAKLCQVGFFAVEQPKPRTRITAISTKRPREGALTKPVSPTPLTIALPEALSEIVHEATGSPEIDDGPLPRSVIYTPTSQVFDENSQYKEFARADEMVLDELPGSEHPLDVIGLPDVDNPMEIVMVNVSDTESR